MERYTRIVVRFDIWRFFFDKDNKDVCNVILSRLSYTDYYNFWSALFHWISYDTVCKICYKNPCKPKCTFCAIEVCTGCFKREKYCTRCDGLKRALLEDEIFGGKFIKRIKVEKLRGTKNYDFRVVNHGSSITCHPRIE